MMTEDDMIVNSGPSEDELYEWWLSNTARGATGIVQIPIHMRMQAEHDLMEKYKDGTLTPLGTMRLLEYYMSLLLYNNIQEIPDELKELHKQVLDAGFDIVPPSGFEDRYAVIDAIGLQ